MIVKNRLSELDQLSDVVQEVSGEWAIPAGLIMPVTLVLEEAFTNIVNYAYQDGDSHDIAITLECSDGYLIITLKDDGKMYDPTQKEDPDINKPLEEREIGGLGIFLIRQFSEKIEYRRIDDMNVLSIFMRLAASE